MSTLEQVSMIIVFNDGEHQHHNFKLKAGDFRAVNETCRRLGESLTEGQLRKLHSTVLVCETDVRHYNRTESLEMFDLDLARSVS